MNTTAQKPIFEATDSELELALQYLVEARAIKMTFTNPDSIDLAFNPFLTDQEIESIRASAPNDTAREMFDHMLESTKDIRNL